MPSMPRFHHPRLSTPSGRATTPLQRIVMLLNIISKGRYYHVFRYSVNLYRDHDKGLLELILGLIRVGKESHQLQGRLCGTL